VVDSVSQRTASDATSPRHSTKVGRTKEMLIQGASFTLISIDVLVKSDPENSRVPNFPMLFLDAIIASCKILNQIVSVVLKIY